MLWCTWVRRPRSSLPAMAATRSPNSAMAAARIASRSCKVGAQSQGQSCLGPPPCGPSACTSLSLGSGAPGQGRSTPHPHPRQVPSWVPVPSSRTLQSPPDHPRVTKARVGRRGLSPLVPQ